MSEATVLELTDTLEQLRKQMAEMARRIAAMEAQEAAAKAAPPAAVEETGITEEELLAIAAAIGAYLGVRAHIRQIRLVGTNAWSQQGRVSIQSSHRLQG